MDPLVLELPDGRVVEVRRKLVLGRDPRCGCPLDDPAVSGLHAVIEHGDLGWFVQDMNSRNGTWLGTRRVESAQPLRPGDVLRLGGILITVRAGVDPAAVPAAAAGAAPAEGEGSDAAMTLERAEEVLGVPPGSRPEHVLSHYEKLAGELRQKVHSAPTPALRRVYQRQLNELARAKDALLRSV